MPKPPLSPFLLEPDGDQTPGNVPERDDTDDRGAMDLGAAELFVVATLRAWVAKRIRPHQDHPDWRELFQLAGAGGPAEEAYDTLMSILAEQAKRRIEIHCCCCPGISPDEASMLDLVAALQNGATLAAIDVLDDWLPSGPIGPALHAGWRFALGIAEAGLSLPRQGEVVAFPSGRVLH